MRRNSKDARLIKVRGRGKPKPHFTRFIRGAAQEPRHLRGGLPGTRFKDKRYDIYLFREAVGNKWRNEVSWACSNPARASSSKGLPLVLGQYRLPSL